VNGLVYIGNGGAEFGVRGYVSAYDANTGKLAWRFYTVPGDPAKGPDGAASDPVMPKAAATWTGEWWKIGGGGTAWDAIVYDAEFDQVLVGVGNGSPWNQQLRSPGGGDNLFLASILALDAKTGAYKWHYQTTPGETWDYTATQPIVLADLTIGDAVRKVAMQAPKNGFFYVIDRTNGRLISAKPLLPMFSAKETTEGMPLSWASAVDLTTGRPVENPNARYPAAAALVRPGPFGAHNWHPMAFSPETGLVYVPVQDMAFGYEGAPTLSVTPVTKNIGLNFQPFPSDRTVRAAIKGAAKGFLIAWDPVRQQEAWRVEHKGPWNGGTLATAGGLVFEGTIDGRLLALDAKIGRQLWSYDTDLATLAGPVSYSVRGEQYVAVLSGDGSAFMLIGGVLGPRAATSVNGRVYAFKIGGRAARRPVPVQKAVFPKTPAIAASAEDVRRGGMLYDQFCMTCHGLAAVGGVNPDLRRSAMLLDRAAWRTFVGGEGMPSRAMPRFSKHLTADDVERIRAYVASELAYTAADRPTTSSGRQP
jgi:quinohemoprotein ethanol dehydrogenase